jgi:hypothetical protein
MFVISHLLLYVYMPRNCIRSDAVFASEKLSTIYLYCNFCFILSFTNLNLSVIVIPL